jgi:hypothetical protein
MNPQRDLEKEREELLARLRAQINPEMDQALKLASAAVTPGPVAATRTTTIGSNADAS